MSAGSAIEGDTPEPEEGRNDDERAAAGDDDEDSNPETRTRGRSVVPSVAPGGKFLTVSRRSPTIRGASSTHSAVAKGSILARADSTKFSTSRSVVSAMPYDLRTSAKRFYNKNQPGARESMVRTHESVCEIDCPSKSRSGV